MSTGTPGRIDVAFRRQLGAFALDAAFDIPAAGITAIFGPSGCGKTTVARCIAGLQHLDDSYCAVDGDVWQDGNTFRPPHLRPVGYVFQEASLFPHLSVRRNLLYGAPRQALRSISLDEVVDLLGVSRLLDRFPRHLSGGERQRVAIGRALLSQPKLLLMDEPLAALDRVTKHEILPFLERLHERLSMPIVYISHDMTEIERLADHLVLMANGYVTATGRLATLQSDPALPLAASREASVSLDGLVGGYDDRYGLLNLRVKGGRLMVPAPPAPTGARLRLRITASDVSIARRQPATSSILNILPARIVSHSPLGDREINIILALGSEGTGVKILARITRRSWDMLELADGMDVFAQIKGVSLVSSSEHQLAVPASPDEINALAVTGNGSVASASTNA
jgi:molybdate transport system ATP-binding protein